MCIVSRFEWHALMIIYCVIRIYTQSDVKYMDPDNLEFVKDPHNPPHKHQVDRTVKYAEFIKSSVS